MDNRTNCLNVGSSLPRWTVRERGIVFRNVFLNVAGKKKGCRRRSPTLPLAASGQTNFSHPFAEGTSALGMRVRDSPEIGSQSHIQITAAPALTFLSLSPTVVGGLSVLGNCAPRKRSPRKLDMNLDDRWTDADTTLGVRLICIQMRKRVEGEEEMHVAKAEMRMGVITGGVSYVQCNTIRTFPGCVNMG